MTTGSLERLIGSGDVLGQKRPARFLRVVTVKLLSLLGMTRPQRGAFSRICSLQTERWWKMWRPLGLGFLENALLISGGGPSCHAFGNRVEHCFGFFISGSSNTGFTFFDAKFQLGLQLVFAKQPERKKKAAAAKTYIENSTFLGQNKLRNL